MVVGSWQEGRREGRGRWWIYLYIRYRATRGARGRDAGERALAARALYYIIGGHFGPPKSLSEHKKYEVLLGPPFFRAASGAASPDRTVTEKGGAKERARETKTRDEDRREERGAEGERGGRPG